jgi:nicotinate phosphoribosyltransferase
VLCVHDEVIDPALPYEIFDPDATWKRKTLTNFSVRDLLVPVFTKGKLVYQSPALKDIRSYCASEVNTLWDEVKRFENPHHYYVDLSEKLWNIKNELLSTNRK